MGSGGSEQLGGDPMNEEPRRWPVPFREVAEEDRRPVGGVGPTRLDSAVEEGAQVPEPVCEPRGGELLAAVTPGTAARLDADAAYPASDINHGRLYGPMPFRGRTPNRGLAGVGPGARMRAGRWGAAIQVGEYHPEWEVVGELPGCRYEDGRRRRRPQPFGLRGRCRMPCWRCAVGPAAGRDGVAAGAVGQVGRFRVRLV